MLYHVTMTNRFYAWFLGGAFASGHSGIDFFFVLSGFIMLYVHYDRAGHARETWRFLAMRAVRIFPIYWCVLAVTVLAFWLYPPRTGRMWAPWSTLEAETLLHAVFLADPDHTIVPVAWTLSYELIFYAFFSLYILCGAWVFGVLALAWSAALAAQWAGTIAWPHPILLRPIVGSFFLGCLAAVIVKRYGNRFASAWWVLLALAICTLMARAEFLGLIDPYKWWTMPYFLLIVAGAAYDQATARAYPRLLVLLGEASYSIYLLHYGMIVIFAATIDYYRAQASYYPNVTLALLSLTILATGIVVHLTIERPLLESARRWIRL